MLIYYFLSSFKKSFISFAILKPIKALVYYQFDEYKMIYICQIDWGDSPP